MLLIMKKEYNIKAETVKIESDSGLSIPKIKLLKRRILYLYFRLRELGAEFVKLCPLITLGKFLFIAFCVRIIIIGLILFLFIKFRKGMTFQPTMISTNDLINKLGKFKETLEHTKIEKPINLKKVVISRFIKYFFSQYVKILLN